MIIVVNINRTLKQGLSKIDATSRAWALNIQRCGKHEFVVGVEKGIPVGVFRKLGESYDNQFPNRVRFNLVNCTDQEKQQVQLILNAANLNGIQRGKYI